MVFMTIQRRFVYEKSRFVCFYKLNPNGLLVKVLQYLVGLLIRKEDNIKNKL